jgi:3-deoxy-manno-octulosonate cytidylyltransferase (CMP-KDO synthetase)
MNDTSVPGVLAVIPARYGSTRFPGKMIVPLGGKPLVYHTCQRAFEAKLVSEVIVATDDRRVVDALAEYDINVVMTRVDHASGTDRVAEVAEKSSAEIIVNIQGDEPLISPKTIDDAIRSVIDQPDVSMGTVRKLLTDRSDIENPNNVKVVCDNRGRALYFSRYPIPYIRDESDRRSASRTHWHHYGLYVYRREFLLKYSSWPQTPLEKLEKLEQLRVLENGFPIAVVETEHECLGVDTPEDLKRVEAMFERL